MQKALTYRITETSDVDSAFGSNVGTSQSRPVADVFALSESGVGRRIAVLVAKAVARRARLVETSFFFKCTFRKWHTMPTTLLKPTLCRATVFERHFVWNYRKQRHRQNRNGMKLSKITNFFASQPRPQPRMKSFGEFLSGFSYGQYYRRKNAF